MSTKYWFLILLLALGHVLYSQEIIPDLQDTTKWSLINRAVHSSNDNGRKAVVLNEMPGDGLMILKGSDFSNGTIELDIKGSDKFQQSFVGLAFHGNGLKTYDVVYFRPFNFKSEDVARRSHAVQYVSMPDYDWEKLRSKFPGKYENKIDVAPNADDWFHVKINVQGKHITVYVNNQQQPCLEVDKLNDNLHGGVGLWVGNNAAGSFANLAIKKSEAPSALNYKQ